MVHASDNYPWRGINLHFDGDLEAQLSLLRPGETSVYSYDNTLLFPRRLDFTLHHLPVIRFEPSPAGSVGVRLILEGLHFSTPVPIVDTAAVEEDSDCPAND
jgi:hypothetical protein